MYLANSNLSLLISQTLIDTCSFLVFKFELINLHYHRYWYLVGIIINITLIIKHIFNSNNKESIIVFLYYICWYSYIRFSATLATNTLASFILPTNFLLQIFLSPIINTFIPIAISSSSWRAFFLLDLLYQYL